MTACQSVLVGQLGRYGSHVFLEAVQGIPDRGTPLMKNQIEDCPQETLGFSVLNCEILAVGLLLISFPA